MTEFFEIEYINCIERYEIEFRDDLNFGLPHPRLALRYRGWRNIVL
jgi:hypothetical protein